mmetsp:Transcript_58117/g.127485  ORF Transcript_58117/g.127485 Transcript_58117/m.127485 type:complete len:84 (-) Transcript_58117:16-267(-)
MCFNFKADTDSPPDHGICVPLIPDDDVTPPLPEPENLRHSDKQAEMAMVLSKSVLEDVTDERSIAAADWVRTRLETVLRNPAA